MKNKIVKAGLLGLVVAFASCGGGGETPESIAKEWCELNAKVHSATSEEDEEKFRAEREKFENDIEAKHKDDEAFMDKVEEEVEKCEDASEGR